jgi:hypothetical protein
MSQGPYSPQLDSNSAKTSLDCPDCRTPATVGPQHSASGWSLHDPEGGDTQDPPASPPMESHYPS